MNLPDGNALDFMEAMKKQVNYAEWLFLTGYGSVPDSVRALRLGAYDFLENPAIWSVSTWSSPALRVVHLYNAELSTKPSKVIGVTRRKLMLDPVSKHKAYGSYWRD